MAEREVWFEARIGWRGGYLPVHWKGWVIAGLFVVGIVPAIFLADWALDRFVGPHPDWVGFLAVLPIVGVYVLVAATHSRLPGEGSDLTPPPEP